MYVAVLDIVQYDCPVVRLVELLKDVKLIVTGANVANINEGYEKIYVVMMGDKDLINKSLDMVQRIRFVKHYNVLQRKDEYAKVYMYISKTWTMENSVRLDAMPLAPWVAKDGIERWTLGILSKKQLDEFLSRVKERDYIEKMKIDEVADDTIATLAFNYLQLVNLTNEIGKLTKSQLNLLNMALESGYYEWPRKINIMNISQELRVSRAAVAKLLRRAEKRVIASVMEYLKTVKYAR